MTSDMCVRVIPNSLFSLAYIYTLPGLRKNLTSKPKVKDNFNRIVFFTEFDIDLSIDIQQIYVKDFTDKCIGPDLLLLMDHEHWNLISPGTKSISESISINIGNNTLEFRRTNDNFIVCFVKANTSYLYYVDSSSYNYENSSNCWDKK